MQPNSSPDPQPLGSPGSAVRNDQGPTSLRLERRLDGKLWLVTGETAVAVSLVRCFPWTSPKRYLSLRDEKGDERAFVVDADELEPGSRRAVEATLSRSSFVLDIVAIRSVAEDFELRSWRVETRHGPRTFQTALDGWPRELDAGGIVIEDVYGDLYRVSDPERLDDKSKRLLWAFVD